MMKVIVEGCAVDQNVVEEDGCKLPQEWAEQGVHGYLERRWCVAKPKRHHPVLVVTVVSAKGCLRDIFFSHQYLVKTLP